jgi:hypothetical protein
MLIATTLFLGYSFGSFGASFYKLSKEPLKFIPGKVAIYEFWTPEDSKASAFIKVGDDSLEIPVIGTSLEKAYCKLQMLGSNEYLPVKQFMDDENGTLTKVVLRQSEMEEAMKQYNINEKDFRLAFPMRVVEYRANNGIHSLGGLVSSSVSYLKFSYVLKNRLPLTFTCLVLGAVSYFIEKK